MKSANWTKGTAYAESAITLFDGIIWTIPTGGMRLSVVSSLASWMNIFRFKKALSLIRIESRLNLLNSETLS